MPKYGGKQMSASGVSPMWVKSNEHRRRKKKERKSVITMVSIYRRPKKFVLKKCTNACSRG